MKSLPNIVCHLMSMCCPGDTLIQFDINHFPVVSFNITIRFPTSPKSLAYIFFLYVSFDDVSCHDATAKRYLCFPGLHIQGLHLGCSPDGVCLTFPYSRGLGWSSLGWVSKNGKPVCQIILVSLKDLQFIEFYAGKAKATLCMKSSGLRAARLDYAYHGGDGNNYFNILTDAGMSFLGM